MSWQGKNIFLTPVHDWMHNCIWDLTWMWDRPNYCQGIIDTLSGEMVCQFCEPDPSLTDKSEKLPTGA